MTFFELMRGDKKEAWKEPRRLFSHLKSHGSSKKPGRVKPAVICKGQRVLKVVPVHVFEAYAISLLDTRAVTNFM